jgi:hypothetical protein
MVSTEFSDNNRREGVFVRSKHSTRLPLPSSFQQIVECFACFTALLFLLCLVLKVSMSMNLLEAEQFKGLRPGVGKAVFLCPATPCTCSFPPL